MSFLVKATDTVYHGLKRHKEGAVFTIDSLRHFSPGCMEFVNEKDADLFYQKEDEILEERKEIYAKKQNALLGAEVGKFKKQSETVPGSGPKAPKAGKKEAAKKGAGSLNVI